MGYAVFRSLAGCSRARCPYRCIVDRFNHGAALVGPYVFSRYSDFCERARVGKRIGSSMNHPEQQYLDLMVAFGSWRSANGPLGWAPTQTDVRFALICPKGRRLFLRPAGGLASCVKGNVVVLIGETNIRSLLQGEPRVTIWSDWPHRRYVEETGDAIDMRTFEDRILKDVEFARNWGDLGRFTATMAALAGADALSTIRWKRRWLKFAITRVHAGSSSKGWNVGS